MYWKWGDDYPKGIMTWRDRTWGFLGAGSTQFLDLSAGYIDMFGFSKVIKPYTCGMLNFLYYPSIGIQKQCKIMAVVDITETYRWTPQMTNQRKQSIFT